ncbi:glycosyltransferase family 2 protein [Holophaga foetida]|uniref:glycosyltransferase family 2 protein n=1 Tax=Holophaga foetida TaxID=35839 RepID=UPI0002474CCD|nr:glycosyltransferase [Holophaga foetida]
MQASGSNRPPEYEPPTAPLVSVCLPVFNGERFLEKAVDSVLRQTYPHFELLIFDDRSTDNSLTILQGIHDSRIRIHCNARNLGAEANWNQAVGAAHGEYVKLFHQDDLLAPDCLKEQVAALEGHPNAVLAFCDRTIIRPDGSKLMSRSAPWGTQEIDALEALLACLRAGTNLIGEPSAVLFRRGTALTAGPFDGSLPYLIDLDYWFRLMKHGTALHLPTSLACFRLSSKQWSSRIIKQQSKDFIEFIDRLMASKTFPISPFLRVYGGWVARMNALLRTLVYRFLIRGHD